MEFKIIISYIVICLTYTTCRLHYLMTIKKDCELNKMLSELIDYTGDSSVIYLYILIQLICCPILAPLSILKHSINFLLKNSK